jgi:predicted GIY-YIG superfamily endonuclease
MPIDECTYTFPEISRNVLPSLMKKMKLAMQSPFPLEDFNVKGHGPGALSKRYGLEGDFPGCYVIIERGRPLYVGISKLVLRRLRYHVQGKTHYDSNLAYTIAIRQLRLVGTREKNSKARGYKKAFNKAKKRLQKCKVAFIEIDNPLILYLFEAYCAMQLDTSKYNSFKTH